MSLDHTLSGRTDATPMPDGARGIARAGAVLAAFLAVAALLVAVDLSGPKIVLADFDDIVRHIQIRGLLHGQDWFDMRLGAIAMPEPYFTHYARIVDLPYVLLGRFFALFLPLETAQHAAELVWPPVMLLAFAGLFTRVLTAIHGARLTWRDAAFAAMLAIMALYEFSPGRIDHHNIQLVLMAAMLAGIVSPRPAGGLAVGAAVSLSLGVGLECLPYAAVALGGLALAAAWKPAEHGSKFALAGLSMAVTALPATIAAYGPAMALESHCDAASAPYVAALTAGGLLMAAAPFAWRFAAPGTGPAAMAARLAVLGVPAAGILAAVAAAWPECLRGHYNMLDPLVRQLWLDQLSQEKSVFSQPAKKFAAIAFFGCAGILVLAASATDVLKRLRDGKPEVAIVWATALASLLLYIALERASRFTGLFIPLFAPALLASLQAAFPKGDVPDRAARRSLAAGAALSLTFLAALAVTVLPNRGGATAMDQITNDMCDGASLTAFDGVAAGRVMAPTGVAVRIAEDKPEFQVATLALQRANAGMKRMFETFTAGDGAGLAQVLAPFDYLAVCARDYRVAGMEAFPLLQRLIRREPVAGLVPLGDIGASDLSLYRIDHAALD